MASLAQVAGIERSLAAAKGFGEFSRSFQLGSDRVRYLIQLMILRCKSLCLLDAFERLFVLQSG